MIRSAAAILGAAMLLSEAGVAWAQGAAQPPPLPPIRDEGPAPSPGTDEALPPYEPQLERLAELMGTLSFMRDLCGKRDGDGWRGRMGALLDAEGKTQTRRDRLVGAFNRGFQGYEATYAVCTPAAELVIARSLAEGDRLARELSTRFGGG